MQRPTLEHNGEVDRNQVDSLEEGVVISGTWGVGQCEATFCTAWATSTVVPINGERSLLRSVMKSLPVMDFFRFNTVCIHVGWWGWDLCSVGLGFWYVVLGFSVGGVVISSLWGWVFGRWHRDLCRWAWEFLSVGLIFGRLV